MQRDRLTGTPRRPEIGNCTADVDRRDKLPIEENVSAASLILPLVTLPSPNDRQARALAAERDHTRRYRRVQQLMRFTFAVAAVAALTLAWWVARRLD